jgi:hypothetical protein
VLGIRQEEPRWPIHCQPTPFPHKMHKGG